MADRATTRVGDQPALAVIRAHQTELPTAPQRIADIDLLTASVRPGALSARHPQPVVPDLLVAGVAQRTSTGQPLIQ